MKKAKGIYLALMAVLLSPMAANADIIINEVNIGSNDYFELYNYGSSSIDLAGYTASIRDSGTGNFDLILPSVVLAANSTVVVVAESPTSGELNAGQNIPWFWQRNLSLSILDSLNNVVDFWAHGTSLFGAPAGVTFSPNPLSLLTLDTNSTTYQRSAVSTAGLNFFASDWTLGIASRGMPNADQVQFAAVPEPGTLALLGLGLVGMAARRRKTV